MSQNILLSIILPCYNVEKYIIRCINSLYEQNIPLSDYEIIVINDCSPDNSRNIVLQYQEKYNNIILIDHQINKGLGASRNAGLNTAIGEYVWFIDTDDFIETNILNKLIHQAIENDLDVLSFNFYKQEENGKFNSDTVNLKYSSQVLDGKSFLDINYQPSVFSSTSKISKREYLKKNKFRFAEGVYWEDADLVVQMLYFAARVQFIPDHIYYYCYNEQSISRTQSGKKLADMVKMGSRKLQFSKSIEQESPILSKQIRKDAAWNATAVKRIIFLPSKERKIFYHLLKSEEFDDVKSMEHSILLKILFNFQVFVNTICFFISPVLIRIKKMKL